MHSDRNAALIVSALRAAGAMVTFLDAEGASGGAGLPDLLVAHPRVGARLLEVKGPRGRVSDVQVAWHARWAAAGGPPVIVVRSVAEALAAIGLDASTAGAP